MFRPPGDCPQCGEFVPAKAKACRECGACDKTGWSDDVAYDGLDLPDSAYEDDDDASANVRRGQDEARKKARAWFWRIVAALLLAWILWATFRV